jgi:hypothetical protein
MIFTELNIGIFLHQNSEDDWLFLDPKDGIDSYGLGFESRQSINHIWDGFLPQDRDGPAFPSSCHLQPFATICNQSCLAW